jgi:hypothetical protein
LVLLTEALSLSRRVGSGSFLPNREIMQFAPQMEAQQKIVTELCDGAVGGPIGRAHISRVAFSKKRRDSSLLLPYNIQ